MFHYVTAWNIIKPHVYGIFAIYVTNVTDFLVSNISLTHLLVIHAKCQSSHDLSPLPKGEGAQVAKFSKKLGIAFRGNFCAC